MSVAVSYASTLNVLESIETNVPAADAKTRTVLHNGFSTTKAIDGASTVPASKVAAFAAALVSGAAAIDLTALTGTGGAPVSLNGLQVRVVKVTAPAGNGNPVTITAAGSNGYALDGTGFSITLKPGQEVLLYLGNGAPVVSGTAKALALAGTGADTLNFLLVGG